MINPKPGEVVFILIDDDEINNMISRLMIERVWSGQDIMTFLDPLKALRFLQNSFVKEGQEHLEAIILLNLNMPVLSGWDFLDRFDGLSEEIKTRTSIYILSSSFDNRDKEMAHANKYVREFFQKPLTTEMVRRLHTNSAQ